MSKIRLNKDHLKNIDYKVTVPMIQCSECGQSVLDTPTNRANNLIHDAMCSKNPTPQPLGMSGEEEWWERPPFRCEPCDKEQLDHYNISAILKEQRRLVIEECREIVENDFVWGKNLDGTPKSLDQVALDLKASIVKQFDRLKSL